MKLLAGGCSFIYGSELADERPFKGGYSYSTYPSLLAKYLGLEYTCCAEPGAGNDAIARKIINNIDPDVELVIVYWSYLNRFEFHYSNIGWQNLLGSLINTDGLNLQIQKVAKPFYSDLTPEYSWYRYLSDIVLLQNFLKAKNIKYIFSSVQTELFLSKFDQFDQAHKNLLEQIDFNPWFIWTHNETPVSFYDWAKHNGYALAPGGHPLELAHAQTAELIKEKINDYY